MPMQTQGLLYQLPAREHNSLFLYGSLFLMYFLMITEKSPLVGNDVSIVLLARNFKRRNGSCLRSHVGCQKWPFCSWCFTESPSLPVDGHLLYHSTDFGMCSLHIRVLMLRFFMNLFIVRTTMWPQGSECTVQQECGSFWSFCFCFGLCHCCWFWFCFYYLCSLNSRWTKKGGNCSFWTCGLWLHSRLTSVGMSRVQINVSTQSFCSKALAETSVGITWMFLFFRCQKI